MAPGAVFGSRLSYAWKHVFTPMYGREARKQITIYYLDDGREFASESELLAALEEA